jgi:hypothetical protein
MMTESFQYPRVHTTVFLRRPLLPEGPSHGVTPTIFRGVDSIRYSGSSQEDASEMASFFAIRCIGNQLGPGGVPPVSRPLKVIRSMTKVRLSSSRWLAVALATTGLAVAEHGTPTALTVEQPVFQPLNLPLGFRQLIVDRETIYQYQLRHHQVEPGVQPTPLLPRMRPRPPGNKETVQVFEPTPSHGAARFRSEFPDAFVPLRGFRAPILDASVERLEIIEKQNPFSPENFEAAKLINDRLAHDGLLKTLAGVLELLGAERFLTNGSSGLAHLNVVGFPDDLLACFASRDYADPAEGALEVVQGIARALTDGTTVHEMESELRSRRFHFPAAWSGFDVAVETGVHEIGLLRMQAGGGLVNGIVPGGGIDVIGQLVSALPQSDFLVSIPAGLHAPLSQWAENALKLRRRHQMTLVFEPSAIETWAQDNGKAGSIRDPASKHQVAATLTPRYASSLEGVSTFLPSESFLMDGLRAAGHHVVQFPLLFQGGNVLALDDPKTGGRLLLLGEGTVHRNVALGLSPAQVKEAFRRGFGVDECVVLPAVSYHLDLDVSIREVDGELIAFVNDPMAAVRAVLELGIGTFEQHALIDQGTAATLRQDLADGNGSLAHKKLSALALQGIGADGRYSAAIAAMFKSAGIDSAEGNLQVFLQALDLLSGPAGLADDPDLDPDQRDCRRALARMETARLTQLAALKSLGVKIAMVPSMPELNRSINYLNGIHHREGYLMPAYGGFYAPVDDLAEKVFRSSLEQNAVVRRIQCADLQRMHGAVHCAAAAYPRLGDVEGSDQSPNPTP